MMSRTSANSFSSRIAPLLGGLIGALLLIVFGVTGASARSVDLGPLSGEVWGSGNRNLVVILHGDGGPGRYDRFAAHIANTTPATTVVTLTRPAFRGASGSSPGQNRSRDHYTPRNNALLADSLRAMDASLQPRRFIVLGHSGGAAQLATVIATHPGTVDTALLLACPCDVPRWRMHRRGVNNWRQSQSPLEFAGRVPRGTRVLALTMERDANTRPRFVEGYVETARAHGATISLSIPPGGSHSWNSYAPHADALIRQALQ